MRIDKIGGPGSVPPVSPVSKIRKELPKKNKETPEDKVQFSDELTELLKRAQEDENKD